MAITYNIRDEAAAQVNDLRSLALRAEHTHRKVKIPDGLTQDERNRAEQLQNNGNWQATAELYRNAAQRILESDNSYEATEFSYIPAKRSTEQEQSQKSLPHFTQRAKYARGDLELPAIVINLKK